jgi:hypothetical protein
MEANLQEPCAIFSEKIYISILLLASKILYQSNSKVNQPGSSSILYKRLGKIQLFA